MALKDLLGNIRKGRGKGHSGGPATGTKETHSEWAKNSKMSDSDSAMVTKALGRDLLVHFLIGLGLNWAVSQVCLSLEFEYFPLRVQAAIAIIWAVWAGYVRGYLKMGGSVGLIRGTVIKVEEVFDTDFDGDGHIGISPEDGKK